MVDLIDRIRILLRQETSNYSTIDYMDPKYQQGLEVTDVPLLGFSSLDTASASSSGSGINEFWREKIVEWSYQVVDHFDFSREVVSVSIHYLDRFLAKRQVSKKCFQLAAMTTLCLAIKLYEPGRIQMSSMIDLSRGFFTVEQMKGMELEVLRVLLWQVHPPTAYCFSKHILFLVPYKSVSMDARHDVLELARFLTELSVIDYYFVAKKPSSVALAALVYAMQEIPGAAQAEKDFAAQVEKVPGLRLDTPEVLECLERLRLLYVQGDYPGPDLAVETRTEAVSPVCVSYAFPTQHLHVDAQVPSSKDSGTLATSRMVTGNHSTF